MGYGIKADIWSFGITALELAHGRPPLSHLPISKSFMMRITNHLKLEDTHDTKKKKFSKAFKDMVSSCLSHEPSKRPTADKLLRHPFFKNCKSSDYLVKNVLQVVPSIEKRSADQITNIDKDESLSPLVKTRRVSGWNFNEDVLELSPVYPKQDKEMEKEKSEDLKESLVPNLVYLLGSLDVQRGMVMNVLAYCGGEKNEKSEKNENGREGRENQLMGIVGRLQQTVDELKMELQREMKKNAYLEETMESLKKKNNE